MRLNLGVPLRALQERLDAVENECRLLASLKTEEQDQIAHLQSRLHALAQAVSELPEVFQEALKEVAAQQARVEANVELTRQSMRDRRETCSRSARDSRLDSASQTVLFAQAHVMNDSPHSLAQK